MEQYRGTTILSVRRNNIVVIGGDGQVSMGNTIMKGNARKVRRLYKDQVIAGFAGGTADAFTLFERFEAKLEQHHGNLTRAAVELAKDWRTDRILRKLEALLAVADREASLTPLADRIAAQFRACRGNYLAFFSSFAYLEQVADRLAERLEDRLSMVCGCLHAGLSAEERRLGRHGLWGRGGSVSWFGKR